jgi:hypothetical protein
MHACLELERSPTLAVCALLAETPRVVNDALAIICAGYLKVLLSNGIT